MKTTTLINDYDGLNARIAALLAYRDLIIAPELMAEITAMKTACGFDAASAQAKEVWLALKKDFNLADEAVLLLLLSQKGISITSFLAAYCSAEGGKNIRRALELATTAQPKQPSVSLPVNWRN